MNKKKSYKRLSDMPDSVKLFFELGKNHGGKVFANSDYFMGKCEHTWEKLQAQSGIGPHGWHLPTPPMFDIDDMEDDEWQERFYNQLWLGDNSAIRK